MQHSLSVEQNQHLLVGEHQECHPQDSLYSRRLPLKLVFPASLILILSIMGNFFLLASSQRRPLCDSINEKPKSAYGILHCFHKLKDPSLILEAGLTKVNTALVHENDWWSLNESLSDRLWDGIKTEQGMVALSKTFTDSKGLPRGVTFPWDEQKGVYFLQAYHTLHCLVSPL